MKCCETEVTTPFCPMCGKAQGGEGPLYDILAHIRSELTKHRSRQRRIQQGIAAHSYTGEEERLTIWIAKWEAWEAAIVEAAGFKEKSTK